MYKVFVNDKPLFLTNKISKETDFQLFLLESIDIEQLIIKILKEHEDPKNHVFVYKVSPRTSYRNYVYDIAAFKKTLHKLWSEITQELNQTDYHNTPREIGRKATSKIPFIQVQSLEDQELIFNLK